MEARAISEQVNFFLGELIQRSSKQDIISPKVFLGLYSYSGAGINWAAPELRPNSEGLVSISDVGDISEESLLEEIETYVPLVVPAQAFGNAPIVPALEKAREIAECFAISHPNSHPPVVINITSGDFGHVVERDFLTACFDITKVSTSDGPSIMIHCKINSQSKTSTLFPTSPEGLDTTSNLLFQASSLVVPIAAVTHLEFMGLDVGPYPRFFLENNQLEAMMILLKTIFWPDYLEEFDYAYMKRLDERNTKDIPY
jgi:hypothetical protein